MANQVIIVPVTSQEDCNKFEKDIKAIRQDLKIHKTYSHKIWILK